MRKIIEGNVDLSKSLLTKLLDLSDVEVTNCFDCRYNDLTSLEGSPHTVDRCFDCSYNKLTSLKGGPHTVGGEFLKVRTKIHGWEDSPRTIGDSFDCSNNNLTSLEGSPHTVGGNFFCHNNNSTSLEGIPKTINGRFCISEKLEDKFPEEYIRSMCEIGGEVLYRNS